jgi:type IV pilus assembly protein PilC
MSRYKYVATDDNGAEVRGEVESISEAAARDKLLQQNLEVHKLGKARRKLSEIDITKKSVKPTEIMHFSRQMSAFVRAGIPITDALEVIADGTGSKRFNEILLTMREDIATGLQFSDALAHHADVLPPYYLGIVRSAELTGRLEIALDQLSTYMERDFETRSKIKSALMYPAVIGVMAVVVVLILTIWVLPKFATFFKGFGARLPLTTRMLIGLADFTKHWWFLPLLGFFACVGLVVWMAKTVPGRRVRDHLVLRLPLIKDIVLFTVVERLCRILGAMSTAAVPLPEAMAAAIVGADNAVFADGLQTAQERMIEGEGLAGPIADTELFPRAALQMIRVGEETGTLDQQLENASRYYEREVDYKLKKLTALFEPAIIVFMGLIVGFVALALVQAMYGIYNSPALNNLK